ncbi:MAG: autotransporter assembly complex protein TamA [Desulfuromonadales bacterium]|jgi:translocation and assembly module TamA
MDIFLPRKTQGVIRLVLVAAMLILISLVSFPETASAAEDDALSIIVSGVEGAMKANVEAILTVPHGMVRDGRVQKNWVRRFARLAEERVKHALQPFGYYNPDIQTHLEKQATGNYHLMIAITPGQPVRIAARHIRLTGPGAEEPQLQQEVAAFPLAPEAVLRHDIYETEKGQLLATALNLGYIDAHYGQHEIRVDPDAGQAEINLELVTGEKHYFGSVTFMGAEDYPEAILRRHLAFAEGQRFDQSRLARTQANFLDTDKFRNVRVVADRNQLETNLVPVTIELDPRPRFQVRSGLGYGTDTGARTSLRFRDQNPFHLGHLFQADMLIAERRQSLTGHYVAPLPDRPGSVLALSIEYERDNIETFESSALSTEASLTESLSQGFKTTYFIKLTRENYQIAQEPSRTTTLVMPGIRLSQRDWSFREPGRVRSGYALQAEVRGSSLNLGSDVSSLQGLLSGNSIMPLFGSSQLILRAEGGTTLQNDFDDLPPSMRFFAGGDQSVRGYGYKSLGPKDAEGNVIGGRHMLVGSIEIETAMSDAWSFALFYDAGNAFDSFSSYEMAQGAGIGIRRYTPIGPIKLDLARQLEDDRDYRLHLGVGFAW